MDLINAMLGWNLFDWIGFASNVAGVIGIPIAAYQAWKIRQETTRERARLQKPINVVLVLEHEGREHVLPVALRRGELTRAELLGRLGMMPMKEAGKRFSLRYLSTPAFLAQLEAAQASNGEFRFVIPCADAQELEQFAD